LGRLVKGVRFVCSRSTGERAAGFAQWSRAMNSHGTARSNGIALSPPGSRAFRLS
jgi:hypothetical protein